MLENKRCFREDLQTVILAWLHIGAGTAWTQSRGDPVRLQCHWQHAYAKWEDADICGVEAVLQPLQRPKASRVPWVLSAPWLPITLPRVWLPWQFPAESVFHSTGQTAWREAGSGCDS